MLLKLLLLLGMFLEKMLNEKKYSLNQEKLQLAATKSNFSSEKQVDFYSIY